MSDQEVDKGKRGWLIGATGVVGVTGATGVQGATGAGGGSRAFAFFTS